MIQTKTLDKCFSNMLKEMDTLGKNTNGLLCKAGLYSKRVKNFESMHQGKHIEDIIVSMTGAEILNTDGKESLLHYGNCDFSFNLIPISMKSSIKKDSVFTKNGEVGASVLSKIFDASRKSVQPDDSQILLKKLLTATGYEIPIMCYVYELKTNKGAIFFTSLSEMARYKDNIEEDYITPKLYESIENLFRFNKSAHYLISLKDAFKTAKEYNRVLEFSIEDEQADAYVKRKLMNKKCVIEEIS